jgi:hypothetical protein
MYFQKILKGIHGLSDDEAEQMLPNGIISNWFVGWVPNISFVR